MSNIEELKKELDADLTGVVIKHLDWVGGKDFQEAALRICDGYFDDHEPAFTTASFMNELAKKIAEHFVESKKSTSEGEKA